MDSRDFAAVIRNPVLDLTKLPIDREALQTDMFLYQDVAEDGGLPLMEYTLIFSANPENVRKIMDIGGIVTDGTVSADWIDGILSTRETVQELIYLHALKTRVRSVDGLDGIACVADQTDEDCLVMPITPGVKTLQEFVASDESFVEKIKPTESRKLRAEQSIMFAIGYLQK